MLNERVPPELPKTATALSEPPAESGPHAHVARELPSAPERKGKSSGRVSPVMFVAGGGGGDGSGCAAPHAAAASSAAMRHISARE